MVVYNISVSNRKISLISQNEDVAVGGNKGDEVRFTFDGEWEGKDKVASFFFGGSHYLVEFNGDYCEVPPIFNSNSFRIGVYVGEKTDETNYMSTDTIEIPCKISVRDYISGSRPNGEFGKNYTYEAKGYAEDAKEYADKAEGVLFSANGIESRVSKNEKIIQNIVDGIAPSHFYVDDSVAYSKDVPSNALPYAEINKVGGNVTAIKSKGSNLWDEEWYNASLNENNGIFSEGSTYPVSSKNYIPVQPLTTYCATEEMWIAYYYADKTVIHGSAHWNKEFTPFTTPEGCFFIKFQTIATNYGLTYKNNIAIQKGVTASYKPYFGEVFFHIPNEVQGIEGYGQRNPSNATEYNYVDFDKRQFVEYGRIVDGAWVRHEDAPVVTDISDILSADNFIEVEGGGTIIAENENKKPVPTEITYMLEVTA